MYFVTELLDEHLSGALIYLNSFWTFEFLMFSFVSNGLNAVFKTEIVFSVLFFMSL